MALPLCLGTYELVDGAHQVLGMTVAEGTAGDVDVLGRESTGHLARRQA